MIETLQALAMLISWMSSPGLLSIMRLVTHDHRSQGQLPKAMTCLLRLSSVCPMTHQSIYHTGRLATCGESEARPRFPDVPYSIHGPPHEGQELTTFLGNVVGTYYVLAPSFMRRLQSSVALCWTSQRSTYPAANRMAFQPMLIQNWLGKTAY
jgi:hypothetical protein